MMEEQKFDNIYDFLVFLVENRICPSFEHAWGDGAKFVFPENTPIWVKGNSHFSDPNMYISNFSPDHNAEAYSDEEIGDMDLDYIRCDFGIIEGKLFRFNYRSGGGCGNSIPYANNGAIEIQKYIINQSNLPAKYHNELNEYLYEDVNEILVDFENGIPASGQSFGWKTENSKGSFVYDHEDFFIEPSDYSEFIKYALNFVDRIELFHEIYRIQLFDLGYFIEGTVKEDMTYLKKISF